MGDKSNPTVRISGVSRGGMDLGVPPSVPEGEIWRYGLSIPFQAGPDTAGVLCNIRRTVGERVDFEVGTDVILFDNLSAVSTAHAVPVSRNHEELNPKAVENSIMVKYPVIGGFVPLGAKRSDGSPHPHAGTGFGICHAISWPMGDRPEQVPGTNVFRYRAFGGEAAWSYFELHQFTYDGSRFEVGAPEPIARDRLLTGVTLGGFGLMPPMPDGDDFLFPMSSLESGTECTLGLTRWQRTPAGWRPVSFQAVAEDAHSGEMSLVRDLDGALLYCARGNTRENCHDFRVWRSGNNGAMWQDCLKVLWVRSAAPVTLNQAADGSPYLAANLFEVPLTPTSDHRKVTVDPWGWRNFGGVRRDKLYLWPLDRTREDLEAPLVVRDCPADFGPPSGGTTWSADHPVGLTVRLRDGRWRHLLAYRVLERGENGMGCKPTPHTGCFLEEVFSVGPVRPVWRF